MRRIIIPFVLLLFIALYIFHLLSGTEPVPDMQTSKSLNASLFEQKKQSRYAFKTDKPDEAMEQEILIRSAIGEPFSYQQGYRFKAFEEAKKISLGFSKMSDLEWVERGPGNVGGRTRSIVVHPSDPNVWLVAAVGGGIWKTEDTGQNWRCVTDDLPVLSATTLALCTSVPSVLYAGTGEGFYNGDAIIGDGLFKSVDEGETWQQLPSTVSNYNFRYINRVIVDPLNPDLVLAATNTGLYRSENGGTDWEEVFNQDLRVQQIIANPLNFNTQFIAVDGRYDTGTYNGGIYKSTDAGQTWRYVSEEIADHGRIEIAMAEADTSILYASPVNADAGLLGFFRSGDAGETWTDFGNATNWLGGQGWYDNALVVSPLNPDIIFVGGIDLYRVQISGQSMSATKLTHWYSGAGYPYVHADQHYLVTLPNGANNFSIIAANDGGIHYSGDRGLSWIERNNDFNVTQYYDADKHPGRAQFIGGTQDNGTNRSPVDPQSDSDWTREIGGDGFDCAWDKNNADIVYGTLYYSRVYRSSDGGDNFTEIANGLPESSIFHTPLEMDPENSTRLYSAGDDDTFYWTDNSGDQWNPVTADYNGYSVVRIAASKSNPDVVWTGSTTRYLNVSTDGGLNFSLIPQMVGSTHAYLAGINTHPNEDSTAFITLGVSGSGKIYRTRDLGQTWENLTNNLPDIPVHTVLVMPFDSSEIWIGTDLGLFISYDEGNSWTYADNGIPAVAIRRLKIVGNDIVAATHGRGIWSVYREEIITPLREPALQDLTVPDPNTGMLKIRFSTRSYYDSVWIYINGRPTDRLLSLNNGVDTFSVYQTSPPEEIRVQAYSYLDEQTALSDEKTLSIYNPEATLTEDFDSTSNSFYGDFTMGAQESFSTNILQSPHPYPDATTLYMYMGIPVTIQEGTMLHYRDVAIVEPGEEGAFYPQEEMWDYVAIEGSSDGDTWEVLSEPYDARFNSVWLQAYNAEQSGGESMMVTQEIDLASLFATDTNIYIRFKLLADAFVNGWGWAIDDVAVTNTISGIAEEKTLPTHLELIGNYPNPFNPQTTIQFTVDRPAPVTLTIYNSLGKRITRLLDNQIYEPGHVHNVTWDGTNMQGNRVASGFYYYELKNAQRRLVNRMLLVR